MFRDWCGERITVADLTIEQAKEYASAAERHPFIRVIECRRREGRESLIVDAEVEVPQNPPEDIRKTEQLAITFAVGDKLLPSVRALRPDFPDVSHLNQTAIGEPKSLCLFEESPDDVILRLTPNGFLERIRQWFERTAVQGLHQEGQALEPFILGTAAQIVIADDDLDRLDDNHVLAVCRLSDSEDACMIVYAMACPLESVEDNDGKGLRFGVLVEGEPITHGAFHAAPSSLSELCELLQTCGIDLIAALRARARMALDKQLLPKIRELGTFVVARIPKTRSDGGRVESTDIYAFHIDKHFGDLGVAIGMLDKMDGSFLRLLEPADPQGLDGIRVTSLRRLHKLTPELAAILSGTNHTTPRAVAVGVGALGSQIILNLARQGWDKWAIADPDHLLPHNLVRHALASQYVGSNKAKAIALEVRYLYQSEKVAEPIPIDILRPGEMGSALDEALSAADVILDLSASIAVSRHLASFSGASAPRVAAFLSPDGRDLVVLSEDSGRCNRLDDIEMQFYALTLADPFWAEHFAERPEAFRYSGACRDVTSRIDNCAFALHGAIASRFLSGRRWVTEAGIHLWRAEETGAVQYRHVSAENVTVVEEDGWVVRLARNAVDRMAHLRHEALPNETGGVLIGTFDTVRRIAYISSLLPSPPDSEEWPDLYIRGKTGLEHAVEQCARASGDHLGYVGEWHSHPGTANPSDVDKIALGKLGALMGRDHLPGLMVIIGEEHDHRIFVTSRD